MIRDRRRLAPLGAILLLFSSARVLAQETEQAAQPQEPPPAQELPTPAQAAATMQPAPGEADQALIAQQLRTRQDVATIHRAFGIATWIAMAATAVLGVISFADNFGFHGNQADTACAHGSAVFQDFCYPNTPWPHAIAGITTTALYATTATLSFFMPEPLPPGADVELHKTLRWFHLSAMVATLLFGFITANIQTDFGTREVLAGVHEGLAVTTFGLLSAAAAVVIF